MTLNWIRVNSVDELEVGDFIRLNLKYTAGLCPYTAHFQNSKNNKVALMIVVNDIKKKSGTYCNIVYSSKMATIKNDIIKYTEENFYSNFMGFTKDMLLVENTDSWIEKLITEKEGLRDEIDLLMDCIFS